MNRANPAHADMELTMTTTLRNHENGYWNVQKVTLSGFILPVSVNRFTVAALMLVLLTVYASAHDVRGVSYNQWTNRAGKGCCNNQDCRPISDENVKLSPRIEVRIEGEWCPVLPVHYLKSGNAPDWNSNHVCVLAKTDARGPCERLLCFQPKPLY